MDALTQHSGPEFPDKWKEKARYYEGETLRLAQENDELRAANTQWIDLVMCIGESVKCLGSTLPDGNQHILRKLKEREKRIANIEFGPEEA